MSVDSLTPFDSQASSTLFVDEEEIEFENRETENLHVTHFIDSVGGLSREKFSTHPKLLTFTSTALKYVSQNAANSSHKDRYTAIGLKHNLCFKMVKCNSLLVKTTLFSYGFQQCSARNSKFNLLWTSSQLKAHTLRSLAHWQRVNHFPRSFEMTRKDRLYGNIARARQQFGDAFNFIPEFYVTPKELVKFAHVCDQRNDYKRAFIMKPVASSRGNGIFIASTPADIPLKSEMIISKYISNPYLINGHKFDLRIYVLVTSFHPLTAYIYNEGLSRFASQLYSNSPVTFSQPLAHLTNYSLNKLSDKFIRNERAEDEDSGHKWTLGALLRKLRSMGVDIRLLMVRIEDIILKTLLSVQGRIAAASRNLLMHSRCCFELFGFDVLIDSYLKPWLLEVNLSPSLTCDSPLDLQLKSALICDVLTLADIPVIDRRNLETADNHSEKVLSSKDAALRYTKKLKKYAVCTSRHFNSYSALKRVCSYEYKARCHYERFIIDSTRRGNFICIFPRENAWALYSSLMEDIGAEKWDRRLNEDIFGPISLPFDDVIQRTHEQLIDCAKYPDSEALDADVRQLLSTALAQSDAYAQRMTRPGINYATKLPRVRCELRRRTKSLEESEAEQCALKTDRSSSGAVSSCDNVNDLTNISGYLQ